MSVEGTAGLNCFKQYSFEGCGRRIDLDGFMKLSTFYDGFCLRGILRSDAVSVAENEKIAPFLRCEQKRTYRKRVIYCGHTYIVLKNIPQHKTFASPCRGKTEDLLLRTASIVPRVYTQYSAPPPPPPSSAPAQKLVACYIESSPLVCGEQFSTIAGRATRIRPPVAIRK